MNTKDSLVYLFTRQCRSLFLLYCLCIASSCKGQEAKQPQAPPVIDIPQEAPVKSRRNTISYDNVRIGDKAKMICHFYDSTGNEVKSFDLWEDVPARHPIAKLKNIRRSTPKDNNEYYQYYVDIAKQLKEKTLSKNTLTTALKSLEQYGLTVKKPETANEVRYTGLGNPTLTMPSNKYLVNIETATIFNTLKYEDPGSIEGKTNALLDCSHLSIYNNLGNIIKEVTIPDRYINRAAVSDDGLFLFCTTMYSSIFDEGVYENNKGFILVNLNSDEQIYFDDVKYQYHVNNNLLYSDNFFQVTNGNREGGNCTRFFLNPYQRMYYLLDYPEAYTRTKKTLNGVSFQQYQGVKERLSDFKSFKY